MKVLLISHASDADGITPLILLNLIFDKVDSLLLENAEVENKVGEYLESGKLLNYDIIYITDLILSEKIFNAIDTNNELKKKTKVFDHHLGNLFASKYSFTTIIDINEEGKKESATSIFYKYLLNNYDCKHLQKEVTEEFVNLVRLYDTWKWQEENNFKAKQLTDLLTIYGKGYFIKYYTNYIKENDYLSFNDKELFLLEMEDKRIKNYIESKKNKIIPATYDNYKIGVVFASRYRSELGNTLAEYFKDLYDFIVIVDIEGNVSYRSIKNIYLNEIAKVFGGGGHKDSAGSPLPANIYNDIIKTIFNGKIKPID